jgi:hypothetical protein
MATEPEPQAAPCYVRGQTHRYSVEKNTPFLAHIYGNSNLESKLASHFNRGNSALCWTMHAAKTSLSISTSPALTSRKSKRATNYTPARQQGPPPRWPRPRLLAPNACSARRSLARRRQSPVVLCTRFYPEAHELFWPHRSGLPRTNASCCAPARPPTSQPTEQSHHLRVRRATAHISSCSWQRVK